ncbi:MAG: metal ABC transporter permease [Planctomycetota bacterium]
MDLSTVIELFGWALLALAATSLAAPLIGGFLYARGTSFHGLVLPQLATFGVALGYALSPWLAGSMGAHAGHAHGGAGDAAVSDLYHLAFGALGVVAGLCALTWLARGRGSESARLAGAFVIASGGTVLCAQASPFGGLHLEALLSGEALTVGRADALLVLGASLATVALVVWAWRDLTLVGHDRAFARALGLPVARADVALAAATAAIVTVGTLALGPLPLFALLVLPALGARAGAGSMRAFLARAALVGVSGASAGAALSFGLDLPLGAAVVAGSAATAGAARLLLRARAH